MRKFFAAVTLVAATFGGIVAGAGAASAEQDTTSVAEIEFEVSRMIMLGGALHQVPLEFGTPVSFIGSVTGLAGLTYTSPANTG